MKRQMTQVFVLAAATTAIIAVVLTVMPRAGITLNAEGTDVVAIDLFGTSNEAMTEMSAQRRD